MGHCHKPLWDNVTILYGKLPDSMEKMVKDQGKEAGQEGPWDCYYGRNFYGWEAERVVAVTCGSNIMERITRARTHLAVILVDGSSYSENKVHLQQGASTGLVDIAKLGEN